MELMQGLEILGKYGFKPFDEHDWDGFAGAESFSESVPPFIGTLERNNFSLLMIIDKNGIEIYFDDKPPSDDLDYQEIFHRDLKLEDSLMFFHVLGFMLYNKSEVLWVLREFFDKVN